MKSGKGKQSLTSGQLIIIVSVIASLGMIMLALFIGDMPLLVNMIMISILVIIMPYSVYKFIRLKKIKTYENEFPNFLRDLSENVRADLSIIQALQAAARSDYGLLSHEIKKMGNQLSWNMPLELVLKNFEHRVAESKVITRSLLIIDQSNKSGGNIAETMESLANNIESIREAQLEKSSLLNQQVMMMYAIFFIFLGITIALIKFLLPLLQTTTPTGGTGGAGGFGIAGFNPNPCAACIGVDNPACGGCNVFTTMSLAFGLGEPTEASSYYKALFFSMILIQGFFSGLIAGQIGADSLAIGIKHSMIMLLSGFLIFMIVIKTGLV
jgi:flagellar protein FlaJ